MIHDYIQKSMIELQNSTQGKIKRLAKTDEDSFEMILNRLLQERENAKRIEVNDRGFAFLGRGNKGKRAIVIGMED